MGIIGKILDRFKLAEATPEHLDYCEFECREPHCSLTSYALCKEVWTRQEIDAHKATIAQQQP